MSWQSLLDMYDPQGDYNLFPFHEALSGERLSKRRLFAEFESITKPTLVMYGLQDEYCYGRVRDCVDVLKAHAGQKLRVAYEIIDGADHSFTDQLPVVAAAVAAFFAES
jgi:pimeloyl-ACP methyl ester carboxylesterase